MAQEGTSRPDVLPRRRVAHHQLHRVELLQQVCARRKPFKYGAPAALQYAAFAQLFLFGNDRESRLRW